MNSRLQERVESFAILVNESLLRLISGFPSSSPLARALKYTLSSPGKCIRSFLASTTAQVFGVSVERTLPLCTAIEVMHTYSLTHDDLPCMDNGLTRRGKNSCHKEFGEASALLVGDALLTLTFELLSKMGEDYSVRCRIIELIAEAGGHCGMVGGQALDIGHDNLPLTNADSIKRIHELKTAKLFSASCAAGAILGMAEPEEVEILSKYGQAIGCAFQAYDDLKDVEEDKKHPNIARVLGKARTIEHIDVLLQHCKNHLVKLDRDVTILEEFVAFMRD